MRTRPSDVEIARRIADLLNTPLAGRAVAGQLKDQTEDWADRAVIGDLRARRLEAMRRNVRHLTVQRAPPRGRLN